MAPITKIAVIIVSYNNSKQILQCLDSLSSIKLAPNCNLKIIIVDNNSQDECVTKLRQKYPQLQIITNFRNVGFAAGVNQGVKKALHHHAQAVLLLNPDTVVPANLLDKLLKANADIAAPVIKFKRQDQWWYDFGGKINQYLGKTYHLEYRNIEYGIKNMELPDYLSGCCLLIRSNVFQKIGYLNEKYFLYFEDVDFCLRARQACLTLKVVPDALITHHLVSTRRKSTFQNYQLIKSNLLFINDYVIWYLRPLAYIYWLARAVKILAKW